MRVWWRSGDGGSEERGSEQLNKQPQSRTADETFRRLLLRSAVIRCFAHSNVRLRHRRRIVAVSEQRSDLGQDGVGLRPRGLLCRDLGERAVIVVHGAGRLCWGGRFGAGVSAEQGLAASPPFPSLTVKVPLPGESGRPHLTCTKGTAALLS